MFVKFIIGVKRDSVYDALIHQLSPAVRRLVVAALALTIAPAVARTWSITAFANSTLLLQPRHLRPVRT